MEGKRKIFITSRMYCKFFKEALKLYNMWVNVYTSCVGNILEKYQALKLSMKSLLTLHCCSRFSGNELRRHRFFMGPSHFSTGLCLPLFPSMRSSFLKLPWQRSVSRPAIPAAIPTGLSRLQAEGGTPCRQCRMQTLQWGLVLLPSPCCKNTPSQEFRFLPFHCSRKARAGLLLFSLWICQQQAPAPCSAVQCMVSQSVSFLAIQNLQLGSRNFLKRESFLICIISPFCVDY